jgi:hypothetical protein
VVRNHDDDDDDVLLHFHRPFTLEPLCGSSWKSKSLNDMVHTGVPLWRDGTACSVDPSHIIKEVPDIKYTTATITSTSGLDGGEW